jgi:hypothetical protein
MECDNKFNYVHVTENEIKEANMLIQKREKINDPSIPRCN